MHSQTGDKSSPLTDRNMRPSFLPRLVNGPFDDPGLFVPMAFHKKAMLFDLGDLSNLSPGDLLKTDHVFVSHTHMDHFVGFDQLLRLLLGRAVNLHLYGPPGFLANVRGKLNAYTWNLVHNFQEALTLTATEIQSKQWITQIFDCRKGFAPSEPVVETSQDTVIYNTPAFQVRTHILDHRIQCLGFAVEERFHVNILKTKLAESGLSVGPWVGKFKELIYQRADPSTEIEIPTAEDNKTVRTLTLGALSKNIARITPGQKFAYITDAAYSKSNQEKIIALARNADQLFIEAAFLEKDCQTAIDKYHLTAHQAGTLAHKARVRALTIFHHSPRYFDQGHLLEQEAQRAFEGS
jgi:ribonuclease Z